jgi:hypothetical protein
MLGEIKIIIEVNNMTPVSYLFEKLMSSQLSQALSKKASQVLTRSNPKYHALGLKIAQKAKDVSPSHQRLKQRIQGLMNI